MLASGCSKSGRIRVRDLRNGGLLKDFRGHTDTVHALSFNEENSVLASGMFKVRKSKGLGP